MRVISLIFFSVVAAFAAPSASVVTETTALLARLPPQRVLRDARQIVVSASSDIHGPTHKTAAELERAKEEVSKAKEIIPRLRKLIRPGFAVFDFPGLLAHGDITWSESSREYELYMGVYLRDAEGQQPYDMKIRFDAKGTIIEIKDVRWKS